MPNAHPAYKTGGDSGAKINHNMRSHPSENNAKLRTIEKQFKPNKAKKIRSFQRRLRSDEIAHELDACRVLQHFHLHALRNI
jgi:hypothetical protein